VHPDRIVVGSFDDAHGDRVAALYEGFDAPIVRTSVASAEMIKLASNAFLATRISFANEIANVSEAVGADVDDVIEGMGLDRRIGSSYLRPGIGYGGSCFPKDVSFLRLLAGSSGYTFHLLNSVITVNDDQPKRVVRKLKARLGELEGKRVALLGLAFKPNTDDMREAPSLVLVELLREEGAEVRAWDPVVAAHPELDGVVIGPSPAEAVRDSDAAVVVTEWPEVSQIVSTEVRESMRTPLIVDGRNFLDREAVRAAGFEYEGIGRA
jgi:UDPglucose 6-dehydrogenase